MPTFHNELIIFQLIIFDLWIMQKIVLGFLDVWGIISWHLGIQMRHKTPNAAKSEVGVVFKTGWFRGKPG